MRAATHPGTALTFPNGPTYSAGGLSDKPHRSVNRVDPPGRETLAERILTRLRQQILSGYLAPGQVVPTEEELCEAFGVGRTTVREALRGLVADGSAVRRKRRLVVVDRTRLGDEQVEYAAVDARTAVRDLYEVRKLLELNAVARAAERWTGSELDGLKGILEEMDPRDADSFHRADVAFHLEIVRLAKSVVLSEMVDRSQDLFFRLPAFWRVFKLPRGKAAPTVHGVKIVHYRRILDTIRRRDAKGARDAMFALLDILEWDVISRLGGTEAAERVSLTVGPPQASARA